jgi:hypothetical protein
MSHHFLFLVDTLKHLPATADDGQKHAVPGTVVYWRRGRYVGRAFVSLVPVSW